MPFVAIVIHSLSFVVLICTFCHAGVDSGVMEAEPEILPSFATPGKTYRVTTKDTVVLPCEVNNVGELHAL